MLTPEIFTLVFVTFIVAGFVKGTVGLGMPLVSIAFMAIPLGLKEAIAIILIPGLATNVWQALSGPHLGALTHRLRSFLVLSIVGTWIGVGILATAAQNLLLGVLGTILVLYSAISLLRPQISPPGAKEWYLSPMAGAVGGFFYGMTGVFMVPGVTYLQALGLNKNQLVQALGISFTVLIVALASAFFQRGFISVDLTVLSFFALLPSSVGVYFGQRLRRHISEAVFRKMFFCVLLVIGLYFTTSAML
jgi:uncharacterized membrane protein YfcA